MAKLQTRKSVSLQRALYDAVVARAAQLDKSMSEYIHELVARDLRDHGIEAPEHLRAQEQQRRAAIAGNAAAKVARDERRQQANGAVDLDGVTLPERAPLVQMRAVGRVSVFKTPVSTVDDRTLLAFPEQPQAKPSNVCGWCCEIAGDRRPLGEHGMHERCAVERARVESLTEARRRHA